MVRISSNLAVQNRMQFNENQANSNAYGIKNSEGTGTSAFKNISFRASEQNNDKKVYENPVNIKTEKLLACIPPVIGGTMVGVAAGFIANACKLAKWPSAGIGAAIGIAVAVATGCAARYNAGKRGVVNHGEMAKYSARTEASKSLLGQVDDNVNNPNIPIEDKTRQLLGASVATSDINPNVLMVNPG